MIKLTPQQALVLAELRNQDWSNRQLSKKLNLPINIITPRNYELRKAGLVKQSGFTHDRETNRTVTTWAAA